MWKISRHSGASPSATKPSDSGVGSLVSNTPGRSGDGRVTSSIFSSNPDAISRSQLRNTSKQSAASDSGRYHPINDLFPRGVVEVIANDASCIGFPRRAVPGGTDEFSSWLVDLVDAQAPRELQLDYQQLMTEAPHMVKKLESTEMPWLLPPLGSFGNSNRGPGKPPGCAGCPVARCCHAAAFGDYFTLSLGWLFTREEIG